MLGAGPGHNRRLCHPAQGLCTGRVQDLPPTFLPSRLWITGAGWLVWIGEALAADGSAVLLLDAAPIAGLEHP